MLLAVAAACAGETVEVPGETVVVEKIVTETVEVPGETVVVEKEVIKTVEVPGETVTKEVVKEVMVPGETVVVEKVVTETVEVPGETVTKEVVKEVMVPGETVIVEKVVTETVEVPGQTVVVEKEVIKTVEVPGETVVVEKQVPVEVIKTVEVVKTVEVPVEVIRTVEVPIEVPVTEVVMVPGQAYVTDPTNGLVYTAPQYGGMFIVGGRGNRQPTTTDQTVGGWNDGWTVSGVLERLAQADWAIDRRVNPLNNEWLQDSEHAGILAESWEQPDQNTFVFNIREGANWHNTPLMKGRQFTAHDVKFNIERLLRIGEFEGAEDLKWTTPWLPWIELESMETPDDLTFVIKYNQPATGLGNFVGDPFTFMYPPEVIREYGDASDWKTFAGTGPFMITEWVMGDRITFSKNPDYYRNDPKYPENPLPYVDRLRIQYIPDEVTRMAAIRAGRIDYLGHNASSMIRSADNGKQLIKTNPELRANAYYFRSNHTICFRMDKPTFGEDIRVRRAMQLAIDYDTINDQYFSGLAQITPQSIIGDHQFGWVTPFEDWPEEIKANYSYDPAAAEALLDEAGLPRGGDGPRFSAELDVVAAQGGGGGDEGYIAILQKAWSDIGVDIQVRQYDGATHTARLREGLSTGMVTCRSAYTYTGGFDEWTPPDIIEGVYDPDRRPAGVNDPNYNELYLAYGDTTDLDERMRLAREMNAYFIAQQWTIWGPQVPFFNFSQPWVQGFNGDFYQGGWQKNALYTYLWLDEALKSQMGH